MYSNIYNPITKKYINLYTAEGKSILNNYVNQFGGKPCRQKIHRTIKLRDGDKKLDLKNFPCFSPRGTISSHNKFLKNSSEELEIKIEDLENNILTDLTNNINYDNFQDILIYDLKHHADDDVKIDDIELKKRTDMLTDDFITTNLEIISNKNNYVFNKNNIELSNELDIDLPYINEILKNNIVKFTSDLTNVKKLNRLKKYYTNLTIVTNTNNKYNRKSKKSAIYRHTNDRLLILKWINIAFNYIPSDLKDNNLKERYVHDFINAVSLYYYYKNRAGNQSKQKFIKYKNLVEKFDRKDSFNIWRNN